MSNSIQEEFLDEAQVARGPVFSRCWRNVAHSLAEPEFDPEVTKKHVTGMYAAIGLKAPVFIQVSNPLIGTICSMIYNTHRLTTGKVEKDHDVFLDIAAHYLLTQVLDVDKENVSLQKKLIAYVESRNAVENDIMESIAMPVLNILNEVPGRIETAINEARSSDGKKRRTKSANFISQIVAAACPPHTGQNTLSTIAQEVTKTLSGIIDLSEMDGKDFVVPEYDRLCAGSFWAAGHCTWVEFCHEAFGWGPVKDRSFLDYCATSGFIFPYEEVCFFTPKPTKMMLNQNRQLHSRDGKPAFQYGDGWGLYFWNGQLIAEEDAWILTPSNISKESIIAETNSERRRIQCEVIGWKKAFEYLEPKVVHTDVLHGQERRLLEVELPDEDEPLKFAHLINGTVEADGTRHEFVEGVPATTKTCHEGQAWAYGINENLYREAVRS